MGGSSQERSLGVGDRGDGEVPLRREV